MKIYGKQVFIGTKKICVEYTSKYIVGLSDSFVGGYEYKGSAIEEDVIFIKDKNGYFIDIKDIDGSGFLALNLYGAAIRYKSKPNQAGDHYIDDLKPYMPTLDHDQLFDLKELLKTLKEEREILV